ncbi:hypothetical protein KCG44_10660 [Pacificimonas sp. WHA3]|uniref:Uncharacterized protein n=1 Tax=Pacificimonas pallii TaxID=2827236 RepID=A0ABS6SFP8_9SPHN|nr:hypothetical protein [Pacificimonas pallii]MBV7257243.1 hypothetical protein [Pacificimonas pallii]
MTTRISLDFPGFDMSMELPGDQKPMGDVAINGVAFYPGSIINSMAVEAMGGVDGNGLVTIDFSAPAAVERVRRHFISGLADTEVVLTTSEPRVIEGLARGGERFRIELDIAPEATASGRVTIQKALTSALPATSLPTTSLPPASFPAVGLPAVE